MAFLNGRISIGLLVAAGTMLSAANSVSLPDVDIGRNLQTSATLTFAEAAPEAGLEITIASEDPARLLLARMPDQPGEKSLVLKIRHGWRQTPEFWLQGLADSGVVRYTASEPSLGKFTGTVRLYPAGIIIAGPYRGASFSTTPRAAPSGVSLQSVRLDASHKVAEPQYVAGGRSVKVQVRTSDSATGKVEPAEVEIPGGSASAITAFYPAGPGKVTIEPATPPEFTKPAEFATIAAVVNLPGIMLADDGTMIGENLQTQITVGLGEHAPEEGINVRVASSDPSRLLIALSATEAGKGEIDVHIPAGKVNAPVYLQSLARSGVVKCIASAPGYRSRASEIHLTPSGVVLMYKPYGPPDEAEVLRETHTEPSPTTTLYMSLAKTKKVPLNVWTVRLDPTTLRSADITVQPLRGGHSLEVRVQASNPEVGTVLSPVKIDAGAEAGVTDFIPAAPGKSVVSVITPDGFMKSANSTSVTAVITP
jgi:hypothetical protein